jgi:hypothetical protein
MKWIVKNVDGVLEFRSIVVCTESQYNKITAAINQQRIVAWCDDNHVLFQVERGEQCMSILREVITEVNESEARRIDRLHTEFLKFIDELPEVDSQEETDKPQKEQSQDEIIEFVTDTLIGLHNNDVTGAVLIASIGPIGLPCGKISHKVLTQMFETWLDKYGK